MKSESADKPPKFWRFACIEYHFGAATAVKLNEQTNIIETFWVCLAGLMRADTAPLLSIRE
jgi:hypothetical protein